jgi:hypothetical protein
MNGSMFRRAAGIAAALTLARAGVAFAGQDPTPPGTVVLGPVQIRPSLILKDMGYDENVFNDPVDPKHDFTFTLSPTANVSFRMRRLRLRYITATDYVYYQTYKEERGTNTSSAAFMEFDLGLLKPYGSISGLNTKTRLDSEVDKRARHRDLAYSAGVSFKVASRTNLIFNGTQTTVAFDPGVEFRGVDLHRSFDGRRRGVDAGISVVLTPFTTLTVSLAREQQRFQLSPDRNSNSWRVTPSFTFSPTGVITGAASVGYRRFKPVSHTLPGYSGLVSNVAVGMTLYGRHQVSTLFSRDVQYSYETANAYYVGTGGTTTWTLSVVGPIDVRATGGHFLMDYGRTTAGGHDSTTTYGGGVGYNFSNRARLGLNTDWSRRDSNRSAQRGYRNHRIFAGLTWGTS